MDLFLRLHSGDRRRRALGLRDGAQPVVRDYVNPWMATLYTTPRIAFAPVLLLWFGIGGGSKVAIVFLGCVFPILINSYYGMRVVNREYVELARSFRLRPWALFVKILLPASVPFILAGIRLADRARPHRRRHRRMVRRHRGPRLPGFLRRSDPQCADPFRRCRGVRPAGNSRFRAGPTI